MSTFITYLLFQLALAFNTPDSAQKVEKEDINYRTTASSSSNLNGIGDWNFEED